MTGGVPPTRRELSARQRRAAAMLALYLKDAHENLHGPKSWTSDDDERVCQIVEDLIDPEEVARAFVRQLHVKTRQRY